MIVAQNVVVRAGGRRLLDDVSLRLPAGSFTALLGPNGAGKTTLLRVLAGGLAPESGAVTLGGAPLAGFGARGLAQRRAVLSQHAAPGFGLNVADTVALGRLVFRHTPEQRHDHAAIAASRARFGLDPLWLQATASLSGGERQRVQIARAAAQLWRPGGSAAGLGLFLDEPAASLDLAQQAQALRFAREVADRGAAVLAVLHDPNHALAADQVGLLCQGRLLALGPAREILTGERLSECFGVRLQVAQHADGGMAFFV